MNTTTTPSIVPSVVTEGTWTPREFAKAARRAAGLGAKDHPPVVIVAGTDAPKETGDAAHYETTGGEWIRHPSAYARKGRSNMVYRPSSRRIVVGAGWRPSPDLSL